MDAPLTVSQFNRMVKLQIECQRLSDLVIVGELKEYKPSSSGHVYPVLTDGSTTIPCTLFRRAVSNLKFVPKVGMMVEVFGSATYYEPYGKISFNITAMKPAGEGEEKRKLDELKLKLIDEGLFDRKRPLPNYPLTVGVVTSATGAVIKDIVDTAKRRFPANILLAPAKVQGEGSAESIVRGIELLNRENVDVIIVGRGGGSAEDLMAFNTEIVARAMFASRAPTISAVGHATDKSIADLVSDRYAETPTAAAMLALPEFEGETDKIGVLGSRLDRSIRDVIEYRSGNVEMISLRLDALSPSSVLRIQRTNLDRMSDAMDNHIGRFIRTCRHTFEMISSKVDIRRIDEYVNNSIAKVDDLSEAMDRAILNGLKTCRESVGALDLQINSLNPNKVLDRGYSYITDHTGKALTSSSSLSIGSSINVRMRDGRAVAEVKEVIKDG